MEKSKLNRETQILNARTGSRVSSKSNSQNKLEELTPDAAKKQIDDFFSTTSDLRERSLFCISIINRLCMEGYSHEAWELIDPNYGTVRSSGLRAFFASADLPQSELVKRLSNLDYKTDASVGFGGFVRRFAPDRLVDFFSSSDYAALKQAMHNADLPLNESGAISESLQIILLDSGAADLESVTKAAASLNSEGLLSSNELMSLLDSLPNEDAFYKWDLVGSIPEDSRMEGAVRQKRNSLISEMVEANGSLAITKIMASESNRRESDINAAIGAWTTNDPSGAASWYGVNQSAMSGQDRDLLGIAFSKEAASSLEFEGAYRWAETVQDAKQRQELDDLIKKQQQEYELSKLE